MRADYISRMKFILRIFLKCEEANEKIDKKNVIIITVEMEQV